MAAAVIIEGENFERLVSAVELLVQPTTPTPTPTPTPETTTLLTETIEFTPEKTDVDFGRCSSSANYTLPEEQQIFSNSGYSIDEKGVFLGSADPTNRLLLWNYQFILAQAKVIRFYFYCSNSASCYLNLFTPISPQVQNPNRYSLAWLSSFFSDIGNSTTTNTYAKINFFTPNDAYYIVELNLPERKTIYYQSTNNYSEKVFLGETEIAIQYQGFLIPGWAGVSNNASNRLRKIEIEKYI